MRKTILSVLLVLSLLCVLASCASTETSQNPAEEKRALSLVELKDFVNKAMDSAITPVRSQTAEPQNESVEESVGTIVEEQIEEPAGSQSAETKVKDIGAEIAKKLSEQKDEVAPASTPKAEEKPVIDEISQVSEEVVEEAFQGVAEEKEPEVVPVITVIKKDSTSAEPESGTEPTEEVLETGKTKSEMIIGISIGAVVLIGICYIVFVSRKRRS